MYLQSFRFVKIIYSKYRLPCLIRNREQNLPDFVTNEYSGLGDITLIVFKELTSVLTRFKTSYDEAIFLDGYKNVRVQPVPKKSMVMESSYGENLKISRVEQTHS